MCESRAEGARPRQAIDDLLMRESPKRHRERIPQRRETDTRRMTILDETTRHYEYMALGTYDSSNDTPPQTEPREG